MTAEEGKRVEVIVLEDDQPDTAVGGDASKPRRRAGTMAGQIEVAEDFDAPLPSDLQRALEGEGITGGGGAAGRSTSPARSR